MSHEMIHISQKDVLEHIDKFKQRTIGDPNAGDQWAIIINALDYVVISMQYLRTEREIYVSAFTCQTGYANALQVRPDLHTWRTMAEMEVAAGAPSVSRSAEDSRGCCSDDVESVGEEGKSYSSHLGDVLVKLEPPDEVALYTGGYSMWLPE
ncbi:MAG: hypothetical protein M1828_004309 [Chrysothrix sp. TS-e1954]|nr:MAG: hypothetical protein M1828_004309 [Chrysothrix sp. TS-e1954]